VETRADQHDIDARMLPASQQPISLVIPVYNERDNLDRLADAIREALDPHEIVFEVILVDDGSTDGSAAILKRLHEADERFKVVTFFRNYGQTAAMSAGIHHATHELIAFLDADLQNDPQDIPAMMSVIEEGYDIVCGWRRDRKDRLVDRKLPSMIANWLISRMSKVYLHDYGCSLKVCKREFIAEIPLYGQMHRFIPIYAVWAGAKLVEVPVKHHPRTAGQTKYGLARTPKVLLDLVTVKFLRDFYVNPIYFFGYFGFATIAAGFACAAGAMWMKWYYGTYMNDNPLVTIGAMCILLGFNAFFFGLIAEVLIRMNFEIQRRVPYKVRDKLGELTFRSH